jgi:hypothetical protein
VVVRGMHNCRALPPFHHHMHKHLFTDRLGVVWAFRDYRVTDNGPEPVRLGAAGGEYRAFVADATGQLLIYKFGDVSYRTTAPNVLEAQLLFAKPAGCEASLIRAMRPSGEFQLIQDDDERQVDGGSAGRVATAS